MPKIKTSEVTYEFQERKAQDTLSKRRQRHEHVGQSSDVPAVSFDGGQKLWQISKPWIDKNRIPLQHIHLRASGEESYILLCCAKDLTLGTKHLSIDDLADTTVITPQMFEILCNAIAIRRFGLDAIQYQGGDKNDDYAETEKCRSGNKN
ncbi:MAG: hypothetical protein ACLRSW_10625 [Christensenellaceae bacterium]